MKKMLIVLLTIFLTLASTIALAGDRHHRNSYYGHEARNYGYERGYDRYGHDRHSHRQDRYRQDDRRYDYRRPPVIVYRPAPYPNYGYGYRNDRRYDYYGNRYVRHGGRYYDQCSSSDRNAAALAGIVLGGAIGSQASDRDPRMGALVGAAIGGLIANEVAGGNCR